MDKLRIRHAVASDAQGFLDLWEALDSETEFMLYEPGEREITLDEQKSRIERAVESKEVAMFVAENLELKELAGFTVGFGNNNFRDNHKLYVVIGLRQIYTGKGLGSRLLTELETWANENKFRRLELSVMVRNIIAIKLYKRHGFRIEGTKKDSVRLKCGFVDEHIMGKILGASA